MSQRMEHEALTVVSPCRNGEVKNQDRARWFPEVGVASVCDGTTTSPYSGNGATVAMQLSPMLFGGDRGERLRAIAEILTLHRLQSQRAPIRVAKNKPAALQRALKKAFRKKLESAFQTTLVAMQLTARDDAVEVEAVWCGDSAFFALSPDGKLLLSNFEQGVQEASMREQARTFQFGPGDALLVKVLGSAREYDHLTQQADLQSDHLERWLACVPLDHLSQHHSAGKHRCVPMHVTDDDVLLVPSYLVGSVGKLPCGRYRQIPFSRQIRVVCPNQAAKPPGMPKGVVTAVLPDHVHSGRWGFVRETVPAETHFVVASDGFYGCFDDVGELHAWLSVNRATLGDGMLRDKLTQALHAKLHARSGDDDISFVWVFPCEGKRHGC